MKHLLLISIVSIACVSCGGENSDGSDATTYTSCSITNSVALFADDRAKDISQCWDGVDYEEKSLAQSWCSEQVSSYISSEYIFGHSVSYLVASTNCP
jgi:hypothetical protein